MPLRMLRYYTDIRFAGHAGHIRQFLIYIGSDRLNMQAGIDEPGLLDYRYGLVDMHRVNCADLLVQDNPDALVLAVLCDFGDRRPQEVVTYIVRRLQELLGTDERRFRDYMTMLEVLSENRDLWAQVEEAEHMLTEIDIERLPSFTIGFKRGEARGEARDGRPAWTRCSKNGCIPTGEFSCQPPVAGFQRIGSNVVRPL
ncbi:hypothetical protein [Candidatus Thiosymbion oneisti]|uniref:hypothetical protein n=1 Tax=Candidatus Thiosymbion oneisti TaxID=589554 RepID=UPI000A63D4B4|nr:hypothetical protein [Candidatus Thiosymbion oneisti]